MDIFTATKQATAAAAIIALLAGCSNGSQTTTTPSNGSIQNAAGIASAPQLAGLPFPIGHGGFRDVHSAAKSWIKPNATAQPTLLYIMNENGTVSLYTWLLGGGLALEGLIAGFGVPSQGCPDGLGNIFIPDVLNGNVMKFAYGETSPLATLPAPQAPFGCSVDRATGSGNLAVTQEGNDTVLVFPNASGTPTSYSLPNITAPEYLAYDQSGDLFVDGIDPSNAAALAELPSGGSSFVPLTIAGGTVNVADNIEWGGTYLLVGDQVNSSSVIDRMTVSGSTATIVDTVSLIGSQRVVGFWPRGPANDKWIATADLTAQDAAVYTWPGGQLHALVTEDISHPIGATIVQRARAGP